MDTLGVIRTLPHKAQEVPTSAEEKRWEQHIQKALKTCGYPNLEFAKSKASDNKNREEHGTKGITLQAIRTFNKRNITVQLKPGSTLCQRPKIRSSTHKQSNVVYTVQWSEECSDLYNGKPKHLLHQPK